MKSKWDGRNKRGGVKCIINHQPLLWVALVFMHFSKGKRAQTPRTLLQLN